MIKPLNILVLHHLEEQYPTPLFLQKHIFFLKKNAPANNYIYHNLELPIPEKIKKLEFDGIILDVTLLNDRYFAKKLEVTKKRLSFLKDKKAFKIAMPQDEYNCHKILDDWLCEMKVNLVYTVIPNHWDVLLPAFQNQGEIKLGYTGYIDDELLDYKNNLIPFEEKSIDVGYRAKKLPPYFGFIGETKWRIGKLFLEKAKETPLICDISVGAHKTILGKEWLHFINNCKFTLGSLSGSSLLDPYRQIQKQVIKYCENNPDYTFKDVEKRFFPNQDKKYIFTAISPRNIEAALLKSCQILVKGPYNNLLEPWKHYIPLEADCSNFDEVIKAMQNTALIKEIIENCYQLFINKKELRHSYLANEIINRIHTHKKTKKINNIDIKTFENIQIYYKNTMRKKYKFLLYYKRKKLAFSKKLPFLYHKLKIIRDFTLSRRNMTQRGN